MSRHEEYQNVLDPREVIDSVRGRTGELNYERMARKDFSVSSQRPSVRPEKNKSRKNVAWLMNTCNGEIVYTPVSIVIPKSNKIKC